MSCLLASQIAAQPVNHYRHMKTAFFGKINRRRSQRYSTAEKANF
jgi:hypothetical protein